MNNVYYCGSSPNTERACFLYHQVSAVSLTGGRAAVCPGCVGTEGRAGSCRAEASAASVPQEDTSGPTAPSRPAPSLPSPSSCSAASGRGSTCPSPWREYCQPLDSQLLQCLWLSVTVPSLQTQCLISQLQSHWSIRAALWFSAFRLFALIYLFHLHLRDLSCHSLSFLSHSLSLSSESFAFFQFTTLTNVSFAFYRFTLSSDPMPSSTFSSNWRFAEIWAKNISCKAMSAFPQFSHNIFHLFAL